MEKAFLFFFSNWISLVRTAFLLPLFFLTKSQLLKWFFLLCETFSFHTWQRKKNYRHCLVGEQKLIPNRTLELRNKDWDALIYSRKIIFLSVCAWWLLEWKSSGNFLFRIIRLFECVALIALWNGVDWKRGERNMQKRLSQIKLEIKSEEFGESWEWTSAS